MLRVYPNVRVRRLTGKTGASQPAGRNSDNGDNSMFFLAPVSQPFSPSVMWPTVLTHQSHYFQFKVNCKYQSGFSRHIYLSQAGCLPLWGGNGNLLLLILLKEVLIDQSPVGHITSVHFRGQTAHYLSFSRQLNTNTEHQTTFMGVNKVFQFLLVIVRLKWVRQTGPDTQRTSSVQ